MLTAEEVLKVAQKYLKEGVPQIDSLASKKRPAKCEGYLASLPSARKLLK